jgi:hypothetical protein
MVGSRLGRTEVPAMAIDVGVPRSRRAVLAAAVGGLAASAAHALSRPTPVLATDGQPVVQGADNIGSASTLIRSNTTTAFQGLADAGSGTAYGVRGRSNSTGGAGVVGQVGALTGANYGVRGLAASTSGGIGVRGEAPNLGVQGISTATTGITSGVFGQNASQNGAGVHGESTATGGFGGIGVEGAGPGIGVYGRASLDSGVGVYGSASSPTGVGVGAQGVSSAGLGIGVSGRATSNADTAVGVSGQAVGGVGVVGWVGNTGGPPPVAKSGVYGRCDTDSSSHGMYGRSAAGYGVRGLSTTGIGVFGEASGPTGTALKVSGKAVFSRSGKATVPTGQSTVIVSSVTVTAASLVLATIQGVGESGLYVKSVSLSVANSRFTIRLSKAVAANTLVGWFIVN